MSVILSEIPKYWRDDDTKVHFLVIGDPIQHSLSPRIHNAWIKEVGLLADYSAYHLTANSTEKTAQEISDFLDRGVTGLNVTLPYKAVALMAASSVSNSAKIIGAANTLSLNKKGKWHANNTDAGGFLSAIKRFVGSELGQQKCILLGAGGSARAVAYALQGAKVDFVLANRTYQTAKKMVRDLDLNPLDIVTLDQAFGALMGDELVINATSLGHQGKPMNWPSSEQGSGRIFDLSYGAASEAFLEPARQKGWIAEDGLSMLVEQARLAFKIWFDIDPDADKILKTLRAGL